MSKVENISITELPDFLFYCNEDHYFGSNDPALKDCPACSEIKAAREEVLEEINEIIEEWCVAAEHSNTNIADVQ